MANWDFEMKKRKLAPQLSDLGTAFKYAIKLLTLTFYCEILNAEPWNPSNGQTFYTILFNSYSLPEMKQMPWLVRFRIDLKFMVDLVYRGASINEVVFRDRKPFKFSVPMREISIIYFVDQIVVGEILV